MAPTNSFLQPNASLKRKLNDPTTSFSRAPNRKAAKFTETDSPQNVNSGLAQNGTKAAFVQDAPEDGENDEEAGPSLPPDDDAEEEPEDDEDGRFFGGGVSKQEKDVLDYIENNEDGEVEEEINLTWLKKTALNFERKINKNAELRAKYEDEPMKFVSSEADLDSEIKSLSILSEHPELYKDFVRSGCSDSLVGLLAHDNTDISIAATEVIRDLIDEDSEVPAEEWSTLVKSMLKAELIDLLVSNLGRLNETSENDSAGVYHILNVMENLLSDTANAQALGKKEKLLKWLVERVKRSDESSPNKVSQNRQYAAEILVILSQNYRDVTASLVKLGTVDVLLQLLSTWRQRDPEKDSDEQEFAENLFDCLVTIVQDEKGGSQFVDEEGIELCLIMLKEGNFSKHAALRLLDHAAGGVSGSLVCEKLVDAGGLKHVFTIFMKNKKLERESSEHLIGIFASLLRLLPGGSPARIRTLAKFVEKDYEKCQRLNQMRREYSKKLATLEAGIDQEKQGLSSDEVEENQEEWLSRRMDAGLFPLQTLNVILAWLIAEDAGARKYLLETLSKEGMKEFDTIRRSLQEQLDGIEIEDPDGAVSTKEMLGALIKCL